MPDSMVRLLVGACSFVLMIAASAIVQAQQPKLEMHRVGVNADDGSGWHPAVSSKGSFSILMPIPFNDFTTHEAGQASHAIGAKSAEGIKLLALEAPVTAKTPTDLAEIPKSLSSNPGNKVSDVSRQTKDGVDTLTFTLAGPATGAYIRAIKTKSVLYMLSIEFPNTQRELAGTLKDKFFASFKLKRKS